MRRATSWATMLLLAASVAFAEEPASTKTTAAGTPASKEKSGSDADCKKVNGSVAQVTDVYRKPDSRDGAETAGKVSARTKDVELGDTLSVEVDDLPALLREQACINKETKKSNPIILFLDDRPMPDTTAYPPSEANSGVLHFPLKRSENSRDVWTYILGSPGWAARDTRVSVGIADLAPIRSTQTIHLQVIPHGWFLLWSGIFLAMVVVCIALAHRSDLLRDTGTVPLNGRRPYSLARVQAAWWFFLITAAYLLIGMTTGDFSTSVTATVLGLLGISAGTAVGSAFIDAGKDTPKTSAEQTEAGARMKAEIAQLDAKIEDLERQMAAPEAAVDDLKAQLAQKEADRAARESMLSKLANRSESFAFDILSDVNGVSFHRFQIVAWTIVLGIIFGQQVYKNLAMPNFDATTLGLLGISSATYLGLKLPEPVTPAK